MYNCPICITNQKISCSLPCKHTICYECIKSDTPQLLCPICETKATLDTVTIDTFDTDAPYQWMYSSVYTDTWWCYKPEVNAQIEAMHKVYETKQKQQLSNVVNVGLSCYNINFDTQKQINMLDSRKQRHIKRVSFPTDTSDKKSYLWNFCKCIGFSGIRFFSM
jgi:hypothetical protein